MRRLGDNRPIALDMRLVAATNRDLQQAVDTRSFRDDLYHRLNVIRIHLPPLRERGDDIELLARHFLARYSRGLGREFLGFTKDAMAALSTYAFPGNVRELSGMIEQAVALAPGPLVELADLSSRLVPPPSGTAATAAPMSRPKRLVDLERDAILERIEARGGDLHLVSQDLGISRTTLWRRMKEYKIEIRRLGFAR